MPVVFCHVLTVRFGAFGAISQIRIIQGKAPHEAHIRFKLESAASNAINWVNSRLAHQGLFAKNGYQKYCTKFLQRKMCTRLSCSLLHAWKPFSEVLNPEKVRQLNPLKRAQIPLEANTNTPPVVVNKEKIKNPQTKAVENGMSTIWVYPKVVDHSYGLQQNGLYQIHMQYTTY